jgi:hypothetical protein
LKNLPDFLVWTFINDRQSASPSYFHEVQHFVADLLGIPLPHKNEEGEHM